MLYCSKCGKKNDDDAQYCTKCGNYIAKSSSIEKDVERWAEDFGKKAEDFGKRIEKKAKELTQTEEEKAQSKPKQCSECKTELKYDSRYCWKCGNEN